MRVNRILSLLFLLLSGPSAFASPPEAAEQCLTQWEPVVQSPAGHPLAPQALACVAQAYGAERCAALEAIARDLRDQDFGIYALTVLRSECPERATALLAELANSRAGAWLAMREAEKDLTAPQAILTAHPGTRAATSATLHNIEALINGGQDTAALEYALGALDEVLSSGETALHRWSELVAILPERCGVPALTPLLQTMPTMPPLAREASAQYLARLLTPVIQGTPEGAWGKRNQLEAMLAAMQGKGLGGAFGALQALWLSRTNADTASLGAATGYLVEYFAESSWDALLTFSAARTYLHGASEQSVDAAWGLALRDSADRLTKALVERLETMPEMSPSLIAFADTEAERLAGEFRFLGEARCLRLLLARAPSDESAPKWREWLAAIESGVWRNHAEAARLTRAGWAGDALDSTVMKSVLKEIRYLYLADDVKAARALIQRVASGAEDQEVRNEARVYEILSEFRYGDVEKAKVLINDFLEHRYTSPYFYPVMLLRAYLLFLWGDEQQAAMTCESLARAHLDSDQARKARELASDLAGIAARAQEPRPSPQPGAPNVIFISLDTTRPDRLGCYGAGGERTPNIDDLAANGTVFERAYSTSSWTKPSHASVFTGRYPTAHGAESYDDQIAPRAAMITERLRAMGYLTMGVISAPPLNSMFGFGRGFDIYDDHLYELDRVCNLLLRGGGGAVKIHSGATGPLITHAAMLMYNRRAKKDLPYFFFVNYFDAHHNYQSVFPFNRKARDEYFGNEWGVIDPWTAGPQPFDPTRTKVDRARLLSLYDDEIASVDAQVGTWLYRTRAEGHFANTIFVVFGDHGEEFLEHGKLAHGNGLNEEVLRVPLIICGPGVPKGKRVSAPVSLVDIVPTVYTLLGQPVPDGLDGIDLGPLMRGEAAPARALFASLDLPAYQGYAVLQGNEKVIVDTRGPHYSLFDVGDDPGEQKDLALERAGQLNELAGLGARKQDELRQVGLSLDSGTVVSPDNLPSLDALVDQLRAMGYLGK